jgi:hypothetical protein
VGLPKLPSLLLQALLQFSRKKSDIVRKWERVAMMPSSVPSGGGERSLLVLLPHPAPSPHAQITMLMETLVRERDEAQSNAMRLGNELVVEREARRTTEARAEAFR